MKLPLQALSPDRIASIIYVADQLFPQGSSESAEVVSASDVVPAEIRSNAKKHAILQRELERLTPEELKELVAVMLIGRDDGSVDPVDFEDVVLNGPTLRADYVADKSDLANYLRHGLKLLSERSVYQEDF